MAGTSHQLVPSGRVGEPSHHRVAWSIDRPIETRDPVFTDTNEEVG